MKKLSRHSLFLLSAFTMLFAISSANAVLIREEIIQAQCINNPTGFNYTEDWLNGKLEKDKHLFFVKSMATDLNIDLTQLLTIIDYLNEIKFVKFIPEECQHKALPFTWCRCKSALSPLRHMIILMQVKSILEKYPPDTTKQLVHTSFAEQGLLQTYCLIYVLGRLGYHDIVVNVIGNEITQSVAGKITATAFSSTSSVMDMQEKNTSTAIQAGFSSITTAANCNITIAIYKSAYDYINEVQRGQVPRSMSFDMIDSGRGLKQIIYSHQPLPILFKDNQCVDFVEKVHSTPDSLGALEQYKEVTIYYSIKPKCKNEWIQTVERFKELLICKTTSNKYNWWNIMSLDNIGLQQDIAEQYVKDLIQRQPLMASILKKRLRGHPKEVFAFLLLQPKSNVEIFTELINETCVTGDRDPIAFELNKEIYTYRQDGSKPVRTASSSSSSSM